MKPGLNYISLGLSALVVILVAGCASHRPGSAGVYSPDTHLIFNPEWTGIAATDVPRSNWPITTAYQSSGAEIEFRETIIDIQGPFGFNIDRTYRRFNSVRRGYRAR